jgi:hypothetical protein
LFDELEEPKVTSGAAVKDDPAEDSLEERVWKHHILML